MCVTYVSIHICGCACGGRWRPEAHIGQLPRLLTTLPFKKSLSLNSALTDWLEWCPRIRLSLSTSGSITDTYDHPLLCVGARDLNFDPHADAGSTLPPGHLPSDVGTHFKTRG